MKYSKYFSLLVLLLLIWLAGCTSTPASQPATATPPLKAEAMATPTPLSPTQPKDETGWEAILQVDVQRPTMAVEFLNDTFGVAMGVSQDLYYTDDAGQTWHQVSDNAAISRAGLDIVDENLAWLVGVGGRTWVSTDGARNWEAVTSIPYSGHIEFISFVDDQTGWAATTELPNYWVTTDGGQTWMKMPTPAGAGKTTAILLRTANHGYLLDDAGVLYTTTDGGQSWSAQSLGLDEQNLTIFVLTPSAAIRFFDADHGLIVLSVKGEEKNEVLALRTTDGGQTWTQESVRASIGQLLLTHDGTILTVADFINSNKVTVLRATASSLAVAE
jgi:photosystem II stability/assembly factor-like uncharacterized protein